MALWELVHLGTPMYSYMLLAFENPKNVQDAARAANKIKIEEDIFKDIYFQFYYTSYSSGSLFE